MKHVPSSSIPKHSETSLGLLDYEAVVNPSTDSLTKKRVSYQKFSPTDIYKIEKRAAKFPFRI